MIFTNIYCLSIKHSNQENYNLVLRLIGKKKNRYITVLYSKRDFFSSECKIASTHHFRPIKVDVSFSAILVTFLSAFRLDRKAAI